MRHTRRGRAEGYTLAEATASATSAAIIAVVAFVGAAGAAEVFGVAQGAGGLKQSYFLLTTIVEAADAPQLNHLSCFRC